MSFQEYSRGARARQTAPLAAFSAFGDDDFGTSQKSTRRGVARQQKSNQRVHVMEGDSSKIYNPDTGRYVDAYGKIGQQVIAKYGLPQEGGFDWNNYNQQITETFGNLYNNLRSTWDSWFTADKEQKRRQSSHRSIPREDEDDEEGEFYEPLGYGPEKSRSNTTRRSSSRGGKTRQTDF